MSAVRFKAPPISWDAIRHQADEFRRRFGLFNTPYFPVIQLLEQVLDGRLNLVEMIVANDEEMKGAEGYTDPAGRFIALNERVYVGACNGAFRHRWTVAHELGHWILHTGRPLARVAGDQDQAYIRPFECAERQAHQFAAELLLPRHLVSPEDTEQHLSTTFGVSIEAAGKRILFMRKKKGEVT